MAEVKRITEMDKWKLALKKYFSDQPHDVYVVYDELVDELIVRFNDPKQGAASYYCSSRSAILLDSDAKNVVGFEIYKFVEEVLPKLADLKDFWKGKNLPEYFDNYRKFRYEPSSSKNKKSMPNEIYQTAERVMQMAIAC
jgi:hypothetical protein